MPPGPLGGIRSRSTVTRSPQRTIMAKSSMWAPGPSATPRPRTADAGAPTADILKQYECGPVHFAGDANASYERHLVFDHVVALESSSLRERFEAVARSLR